MRIALNFGRVRVHHPVGEVVSALNELLLIHLQENTVLRELCGNHEAGSLTSEPVGIGGRT
jgi:hypothetical protein